MNENIIPAVYLGLSATTEATKNTGVIRYLYNKFFNDAQNWEHTYIKKLLMWYTTITPPVFIFMNNTCLDHTPTRDGTYSNEAVTYARAICSLKNWPFSEFYPFALKNVAINTRYSQKEQERIKKICHEKNFTLFTDLNIQESNGDRLLCFCRVPEKNFL